MSGHPNGEAGKAPGRAAPGNRHRCTVQNFRKDCLRELKKIKISWPSLHYATAKGVLILYPSAPSILPVQRR